MGISADSYVQDFSFSVGRHCSLAKALESPGGWQWTASRDACGDQTQLVPPLSAQQFRLLMLLYENPGQVISRMDLVTAVWERSRLQAYRSGARCTDPAIAREVKRA